MSDIKVRSNGEADQPAVGWAPWATPRRLILFVIGWLVVFAIISFFVSNPFRSEVNAGATPDYWTLMVLHGLLVGMVGLMALVALQVMGFKSFTIKALIAIAVVLATVLASIGGLFDTSLQGNEIPRWLHILGYFCFDATVILLFIGILLERSRALAIGRLPFVAGLAASVGLMGAAIMGHIAGWIMEFGENTPSLIANYRQAVGFGKSDDFVGALVGSHSHEMAVAAMALAITLLAVQFGYSRLSGTARTVARIGMGMVVLGTVGMTLFYVVTGVTTWAPPDSIAQFGSDPNVIPLDDVITGIFVMGGGVVVVAAFVSTLLKAPVRLAAAWAWMLAIATVAVAGYTIELNTSYFGAGDQTAGGAAKDAIFTWLHQDIGLFLLPTMLVIMLAVERLVAGRVQSEAIGWLSIIGTTVLFLGGMFWVFVNPDLYGPGYLVSTLGILITGTAVLATLWYGGLAKALRPSVKPTPVARPLPH